MKLNFPILDEPISLDGATILAVEDVKLFSSIVKQVYSYT
ncbi:type II-A CRISPR-associated protein Csn2, partial [Streptococcus pyogenes]